MTKDEMALEIDRLGREVAWWKEIAEFVMNAAKEERVGFGRCLKWAVQRWLVGE